MEESEEPTNELCRFDRFIETFGIHQWSFEKIDDHLVVPLGMISVEDDSGIVDHLDELPIIER
jgi:hypothetical protein